MRAAGFWPRRGQERTYPWRWLRLVGVGLRRPAITAYWRKIRLEEQHLGAVFGNALSSRW